MWFELIDQSNVLILEENFSVFQRDEYQFVM